MGNGVTRNMHYLPQCYLKGFAKAPSKKSQLHVYDVKKWSWFSTVPRNVGARRDFNTVKIDGLAPDAVESMLSGFETKFDRVLSRMRETTVMPVGEDYQDLMALIALIAIRNPHVRKNHNKFLIEVAERITDLTLASKERWESSIQRMRDDGVALPGPELTYEDMVKFHDERNYEITIGTTMNVVTEMKVLPDIAALLERRHWTLIVAEKDAGHFVCCDHPVSLTWNDAKRNGFYPPGYGLTSTEVVFPVMKEMALIGTFEQKDRLMPGNPKMVALVNSRIVRHCDWQIYSPRPEFSFMGGDHQIYNSEQLKNFIAA